MVQSYFKSHTTYNVRERISIYLQGKLCSNHHRMLWKRKTTKLYRLPVPYSLRRREMQYRCQSLGDDTEHDRQIVYLQLWRRQGHPRECPYSTKIMACDSHAAGRECCPENFIAVSSSSNIIVSHSKGHGMLPYEGVVSCPWVKGRILHGTGHPFPDSNVYIVSVQLESYISVSYHPSKPSWLAIKKDW